MGSVGQASRLLAAQSKRKYKVEEFDSQSCLRRDRAKFDLAADCIDYEDCECTAKWQMAQERQKVLVTEFSSLGSATVLVMTAAVQEQE